MDVDLTDMCSTEVFGRTIRPTPSLGTTRIIINSIQQAPTTTGKRPFVAVDDRYSYMQGKLMVQHLAGAHVASATRTCSQGCHGSFTQRPPDQGRAYQLSTLSRNSGRDTHVRLSPW